MNHERLAISAQSVAAMLDVSVRQVRDWQATGGIGPAPTALGERLLRWDAEEVRHWWSLCRREGRRIGRAEWARLRGTLQ